MKKPKKRGPPDRVVARQAWLIRRDEAARGLADAYVAWFFGPIGKEGDRKLMLAFEKYRRYAR